MKKTEKPETYRLASGWQKTTASVKYDDGEWLVQSETVKDMLGRTITSSRAGTGGAMLTTSNVYNNAGLLVRTVNHDGSSVVYAYNELNERVANIRIGAGQTLDFNAQSFILDDVIELDKYLISLTTERTENTEGEWWKCAESISYMPGENALTTSVQRVQLTGLTLENNSKSISIDADGNTSVTTESLNPASVSKVVTSINTTLDITNVSHYVAGYETCS
jgi:YD repeat-containing protein